MHAEVCDQSQCLLCDGGAPQVELTGNPGWNYVLCEVVGSSVHVTFDLKKEPEPVVGVCEMDVLGVIGNVVNHFSQKPQF